MTQQVLHQRITIPSTNDVVDPVTFNLNWEATGSNVSIDLGATTTPTTVVNTFLNNLFGSQSTKNCVLLTPALSRATNAVRIDYTDVTAHLDGSSTGSPFHTDFLTLGPTAGSALPAAACACFALRADYGSTIEHGDIEEIPTDDAAIDQGAPPTHPGRVRPRARLRTRMYFGPLTRDVQSADGYSFVPGQITDWGYSLQQLGQTHDEGTSNQFNLVVWSKRSASVASVSYYFVNESFAYQRRRSDVTQQRVHNWVHIT